MKQELKEVWEGITVQSPSRVLSIPSHPQHFATFRLLLFIVLSWKQIILHLYYFLPGKLIKVCGVFCLFLIWVPTQLTAGMHSAEPLGT